ncbi:unnamed protein product [Xylocopa violacea]|uniref:Uncharacterized protein n=1 Tax=Xylocopa violacea TaxID=135666 RepID=A0ABP1N8Y3_XYLVO
MFERGGRQREEHNEIRELKGNRTASGTGRLVSGNRTLPFQGFDPIRLILGSRIILPLTFARRRQREINNSKPLHSFIRNAVNFSFSSTIFNSVQSQVKISIYVKLTSNGAKRVKAGVRYDVLLNFVQVCYTVIQYLIIPRYIIGSYRIKDRQSKYAAISMAMAGRNYAA